MCALVKPTLLAQVSLRWVFICVCTHCLDTGLYRWLPLKWMKLGSKLQCEVRGEVSPAWRGFKVRGDAFIHYRQTDTFIHYRQTAGGEAGTLTCWRTHSPHTHLHTLSAGYLASHTHTLLPFFFSCIRGVSDGGRWVWVLTRSKLALSDLTAFKTLRHVGIQTVGLLQSPHVTFPSCI